MLAGQRDLDHAGTGFTRHFHARDFYLHALHVLLHLLRLTHQIAHATFHHLGLRESASRGRDDGYWNRSGVERMDRTGFDSRPELFTKRAHPRIGKDRSEKRSVGKEWVSTCKSRVVSQH